MENQYENYGRAYYQAHKEQLLLKRKEHYYAHREATIARHKAYRNSPEGKAWREGYRDRERILRNRYYEKHKDRRLEYQHSYNLRNRETRREYARQYSKAKYMEKWYHKVRVGIINGISTKVLPVDKQEKWWTEFLVRVKAYVPESTCTKATKENWF